MIKNIVFDIGNVLAKFRWKEYIDDLGFDEDISKRIAEATVLSGYWNEVDKGVMTMQEIIEGCVSLDKEIETEIREFYRDRTNLVVEFGYAEKLVSSLKDAGYGIYILSNYGEENFAYVKDIFSFMKYIDGAVVSYEVKMIKPDPLIYQTLLTKFDLIAGECVFLDDLEANIKAAEQEGIHTIHFTDLKSGLKGLRKLGVDLGIDSLIFDLDGTLWDSTREAAKVWTEVSKEHGVDREITHNELKQLYGLPLEKIASGLFPELKYEDALKIMEESVVRQCPVLVNIGGTLFDGVEAVLKELSRRYSLHIVSNCRNGYIEAFLQHYKYEQYFTDFECPGRTGLSKAENIKLVTQRNQLKVPVYIGDTEGDMNAAKEAGLPFIYAAYGFGNSTDCEIEIESFKELLELF